ncbi:MAG: NAD(P)/FAD-dependent oxidoreductase [Gammaproteobacteria bacterium]
MPDGTADILIVGAGIAGASLACELGTSASVVLLEAEEQPGYHATGRSAAFFLESYGNETIRALTRASRGFFEHPPDGFCDAPLLTPQDCIFVAASGDLDELRAQYEQMREVSDSVSVESTEFALERVPVLRPAYAAGCLWERGAQRIDVHALLSGYLKRFRSAGGRLVTGAQVTHARREGKTWHVESTAGEFRARVIVNAAGAWADAIAELAGAAPRGLQVLKRTACLIETEPVVEPAGWAAVTDVRESFYFMPEAGQLLLSPADETPVPAGDAYPDDLDVAIAVDRFEAATTLSVRRVSHQWAGLRTFAPDRSPVVGFDAGVDGFFWLAGQGGYGIQTAPALSRQAGKLLQQAPLTAESGSARR